MFCDELSKALRNYQIINNCSLVLLRKGVFVKKTKAMATTGKDGRGKWLDATRQ